MNAQQSPELGARTGDRTLRTHQASVGRGERGQVDLVEGTTLQRFTGHLGLASAWLELVGRPVTEASLDRVMRRYDAATLRTLIVTRRADLLGDACVSCGALVSLHRDRRSNLSLSCVEVLRRFGQADAS